MVKAGEQQMLFPGFLYLSVVGEDRCSLLDHGSHALPRKRARPRRPKRRATGAARYRSRRRAWPRLGVVE